MTALSGTQYEELARDLITTFEKSGGLVGYKVGFGPKNRLTGASGYAHQIDLSLLGSQQLFLFELKRFKKPIGVAEMLVIASRKRDISAAYSSRDISASLVSTQRPSRNVAPLAQFFGIKLEIVENIQSYGLSFAHEHFVGHVETIALSDSCNASVGWAKVA